MKCVLKAFEKAFHLQYSKISMQMCFSGNSIFGFGKLYISLLPKKLQVPRECGNLQFRKQEVCQRDRVEDGVAFVMRRMHCGYDLTQYIHHPTDAQTAHIFYTLNFSLSQFCSFSFVFRFGVSVRMYDGQFIAMQDHLLAYIWFGSFVLEILSFLFDGSAVRNILSIYCH